MAITQKLREIGGIINSTDLNYNFDRMQEDLQLAVEGVVFKDKYAQVETIADRNAIPESDLVQGLWVAVSENGVVYEYNTRQDLAIAGEKRSFGIAAGDLPAIPYRIEGDLYSGVLIGACYVCKADSRDADWKYTSETTGVTYNDGDWAVFKKADYEQEGHWEYIPKWIPIMNVTSILENNLIGKLEDLHTDDKYRIVNAINEIHDDLGDLDDLTTDIKGRPNTFVDAINELDARVGELPDLKTANKTNTVAAINEVDDNVGPIENLTTVNKGNTVLAINELDSEVGDLANLHTEAKNTIVDSINEVHDDLGTLSNLTTDVKSTAVDAINELDTRVGELPDLTTTDKTNTVAAINEVDKDVGNVGTLTTTNKTDTVSAINELKAITDTLRGATIVIGRINLDTAEVTQEALTARALEIMGGTEVQTGWTLVDNEFHEWHYNGENWQDLEHPNIYPAQNDVMGTVIGNANGDISIQDGNMTVLHAQNASNLGGQGPTYYATKDEVNAKADKDNVLELDNTTPYIPTQDYHPATKEYVDSLIGGASWGEIVNNIEDQEDLMQLLNERPTKAQVLTTTNTTAYTPTANYHPATKMYVDERFAEGNRWGQIGGDIADQQDLQNELINKQDKATAWNTTNLVVSTEQPDVPAQGYIVWIDLNS